MVETNELKIDIEVEAITGYHLALATALELKERLGSSFADAILQRMTAQREDVLSDKMLGDAALLDEGIRGVREVMCPPS